jgi:hypothetical protein
MPLYALAAGFGPAMPMGATHEIKQYLIVFII